MRQLDGLKEKTNEELLAMYDRDRQLEVKQELTLRYLYIAKAVAIQMHNLYADFMQMEDIINEGAIAIMKGIERYDRNGITNSRHLFPGASGDDHRHHPQE